MGSIDAVDAVGPEDEGLAALIDKVGWRRYWVGRYQDAEGLLLRSLSLRLRLLGPGDQRTAESAIQLAIMYDYRGFDVDPGPYYRQALEGYEASLGINHPETFKARYRLADYLDRRGGGEAEALLDDLVARILSPDPPISQTQAAWMMGICCDHLRAHERGREAEAIEAWVASADRTVEDARARVGWAGMAFGPDSPQTADALHSLSLRCSFADLPDESEEAARRAHANLLARLGPDDPATGEVASWAATLRNRPRQAEAALPRARRLTRDRPKLFDGTPWLDERRADLVHAYLDQAGRPHDPDDPTGAGGAIIELTCLGDDIDELWSLTLGLIAGAPNDEWALQSIAAGPLEDLLSRFDGEAIERVEAEASRDPKFRRVLSGVWRMNMSADVWGRVRAIQAAVPDPLPEMRPSDAH